MSLPQSMIDAIDLVLTYMTERGAIPEGDRQSVPALIGQAVGAALWGAWRRIEALPGRVLPTTANMEYLRAWGAAMNLSPLHELTASGVIGVEAENPLHTSPILIPAGTRWKNQIELTYTSQEDVTLAAGIPWAPINVTADAPGEAYNVPRGQYLAIVTPVVGIRSAAFVSWISGGVTNEPVESFRARVLEALRHPRGQVGLQHINEVAITADGTIRRVWGRTYSPGTGFLLLDSGSGYNRRPSNAAYLRAKDALSRIRPPGIDWFIAPIGQSKIDLKIRIPGGTENMKAAIVDSVATYLASIGPKGKVEVWRLQESVARALPAAVIRSPTADITLETDVVPCIGDVDWDMA